MSGQQGKRKRKVVMKRRREEEERGKRKSKREKKEQITQDDGDVIIGVENDEQRERRSEDVLGKREQEMGGEEEREREEVVMKRRRKEEEERKKRFECGVCLELMNWEKEPRLLPCCALSFCSLCLNKLFLPSSSSSFPSSSSSSSSSLKGVKCPVCREMNECETIETLSINYLIPETIDVLLSSNLISFSPNQSGDSPECANFETCGEQTRMFCSICNMFICDSCDPSHTSTIFSRNHKRTERDGDGGRRLEVGLENLKKRECSKHPPEIISGYCFECSSFVCVCCILETHGEHREKVKSIEESILEKKNEVIKIGDRLEKRLIFIEEKRKRIEEEVKELEEKLEEKRIEKKEIELEKEDLRIRKDSIIRLSNTPTTTTDCDLSLFFDDQLFSTLLQTANDIVSEGGVGVGNLFPKGVICCGGGGDSFRFVSSFPLKNQPLGVSVNSDGNIFICGYEAGLSVRDKEGKEIESIQEAINSLHLKPVDVSIGLNDQIVVLDWSQDSHRVVILNKEGEMIKSFGSKGSEDGQFDEPNGVGVDEEGRIIVCDTFNHQIQVFENDGSFVRSFGSKGSSEGQFDHPSSAAVDRDGNIVLSDSKNDRVQVFDIEGNFIRCFGTKGSRDSQLGSPSSVDVDGEGRIVVCEAENRRVSVFEKDGTFLFSFGKHHMKNPHRIVVDSFGTIIVSDWVEMSIAIWSNES